MTGSGRSHIRTGCGFGRRDWQVGAVKRRSVIRRRGRSQIRSISSTRLAFLPARISRQSAMPMLKREIAALAFAVEALALLRQRRDTRHAATWAGQIKHGAAGL